MQGSESPWLAYWPPRLWAPAGFAGMCMGWMERPPEELVKESQVKIGKAQLVMNQIDVSHFRMFKLLFLAS